MKRRDALAALSGLGALAVSPAARASIPRDVQILHGKLREVAEDPEAPLASLATLVLRGGKLAYEGHFGRQRIDATNPAHDVLATRETLYRIASISKVVVTLAVLRLVESGQLDLDRDAGDYLGFKLRNPHYPDVPVTLRQMLTHTSSLRDDGGYFFPEAVDLREVLVPGGSLYGEGRMWAARAKPGEYFRYTNFTWGITGTILERATGERFDRMMKQVVLDPLGMSGGFNPAEFDKRQLSRLATLYRKRSNEDDDAPWNPKGPWIAQVDDYFRAEPVPRASPAYRPGTNGTLFGPQGNLRASAGDLGRVMRMLIDGGTLDGERFLKASTVEEMLSTQWRYTGAPTGHSDYGERKRRFQAWGLGVQHFRDVGSPGEGDRLVEGGGFIASGHLGDAWGLRGVMAFDRAARDGMLFLCGGTSFDPRTQPGGYSSFVRFEERILTAMGRFMRPRSRAT